MEDWVKICKGLALSSWDNQEADLHLFALFLFLILHPVYLKLPCQILQISLSNPISG